MHQSLLQVAKDVYFTEFKRLYEVEKYSNPGAEEIKDRLEKSKGKVAGDWRPNSPGKKMCALRIALTRHLHFYLYATSTARLPQLTARRMQVG